MASIADERLEQLATLVAARKITPATIRVVDVPAPGRRSSAASARWTRFSPSRTGSRPVPIRR